MLASHTLARQTSPFKRHLDEQLKHFNFKPHRYTDFDLLQVLAVSYLPTLLETNIGAAYQDCGTSRVFFSFTDIETWALTLNRQVDLKSKYDAIVAVARGGLYLGAMLSHFSGLPLAVVSYHRPSASVHWSSPELNPGARVLLVEDIAGMGVTLVHCKQALQAQGHIVDVAVLAFDAMSREAPTFGIDCAGHRVVFPWERGLIKLDDKVNAQGEYLDPWLVGFDLDGVFLPDVPTELYRTDLPKALALREELQPYSVRPAQWSGEHQHPIITGRLMSEFKETTDWLAKFGLSPSVLHMRPNLHHCPAQFKATKIRELNITEFIESELWQAELISTAVPYCVVWHYDALSERLTRM